MNDPITIRRAQSVGDYRACQDAQRRAWGISDEGYLVPVATMVGANLHGGLVLGAFRDSGEAVAMSFAFLGRVEGRLCLYSQLTGVVPEYQSRGLGFEIKRVQQTIARDEGIERIAWAFDPLQAGNAHFNLARLGATAGSFIANMYGIRTDKLNAGVATDRLIVEWETSGAPPRDIPAAEGLPRLIRIEHHLTDELSITPELDDLSLRAPAALLQIPSDIARLRRDDPAIAERWRVAVSKAFQTAFAAGFRAVSFLREDREGQRRSYYVVQRI